jgi:hypothetical protein
MLTLAKLIVFFTIIALPLFVPGRQRKALHKRKQDTEVYSEYSVNEDGNIEWSKKEADDRLE